jgi:hypothetical protein
MPTRKVTTFEGSAGEALELLRRLLARGVVSATMLADTREGIRNDIRAIEERLGRYKGLLEGAAAVAVAAAAVPAIRHARNVAKNPRQPRQTAARGTGRRGLRPQDRAEIRQLQGKYLALSRQLPKNERLQFKSMIATAGKQATVDAMQARVDALTKRSTR